MWIFVHGVWTWQTVLGADDGTDTTREEHIMAKYLVTWETFVDADSPIEAAKQARGIQRDVTAWTEQVYQVNIEGEPALMVDLHDGIVMSRAEWFSQRPQD